MKSLGEQEQQQKLKIYMNCFIFISNRCMTYLSKSWTPNDSIYSFTHCKAVMKLTVSNGLSLQTFISKCMICCSWQFQVGGSIARYAHFNPLWVSICLLYVCIVLDLAVGVVVLHIYMCSVAVCKASMLDWLGRTYAPLHCAMPIYLV